MLQQISLVDINQFYTKPVKKRGSYKKHPKNGRRNKPVDFNKNYNQSEYSLPDDDYRFLLKFKSAVNVMRGSERGIDDALWNVFQGDVLLKNNHNLTITYIVSAECTLAALAAKQLGYYRAPEGVGANYVLRVPSPSQIFGFNRKGIINKTVVGFSTKDKRQTGTWLTKENLISLVTPQG